MITREVGENFKVIVSTKKTLLGASASKFSVTYADVNDLGTETIVAGGATEAMVQIATGSEHVATLTAVAAVGTKLLLIDTATSTLVAGDTIEYATGLFTYVQKIVGTKVYLRTPIAVALASGVSVTQAGNLGNYATQDISIATAGEYIVSVESNDFGIFVEQRVKVVATLSAVTDADAPVETIAVAM